MCNSFGETYICAKMVSNPFQNVMNFDTFGWSLFQIVQCVTLEGWSDAMYILGNTNQVNKITKFFN